MRALGPVFWMIGIAVDLDLSKISIGFSRMASIGFINLTCDVWLSAVRSLSLSVSVISARGVTCSCDGSGDIEGCGVGNGGARSGIAELREAFVGALFRFRGEALFVGDSGSGWTFCSGSKSSVGSMFSLFIFFLDLAVVLGVLAMELVVFRLDCVCFRGLLWEAGAKSSPLSSSAFMVFCISSSSSEDSNITLRRVAARLEGLVGDSVDISSTVYFVYFNKTLLNDVIIVTWTILSDFDITAMRQGRQVSLYHALIDSVGRYYCRDWSQLLLLLCKIRPMAFWISKQNLTKQGYI